MIRAAILTIAAALLFGGFVNKAISNSNATIMQQSADTGVWHVLD